MKQRSWSLCWCLPASLAEVNLWLQSHSREQKPFPSFLCHSEEELCLYQHSCQQMPVGPVSTNTMFNFSLNRPDFKKRKKKKESDLWSKCMQLLGMKLCFSAAGVHRSAHPAAAWSSSGTPKVPVQPGEVLLPVWGWAGCPAPEYHLSTAVLWW